MDNNRGTPPLVGALELIAFEEKLRRTSYRLLGGVIKQLSAHIQKEVKLLSPHKVTDLAEDVEYFNAQLCCVLGIPAELLE